MRILVTGGAGFVSSHIIDALIKKRHKVFFVDNFSSSDGSNLIHHKGGKLKSLLDTRNGLVATVDIADLPTLDYIFSDFKPWIILHLAAQPSLGNSWLQPRQDAVSNIFGTIAVLDCCVKYKVKRLVFASTSAVYANMELSPFSVPFMRKAGDPPYAFFEDSVSRNNNIDPSSPYGLSKLTAENYIRMFFPEHIIFRLGNVYGPRQIPLGNNQLIPRAIKQILGVDEVAIKGKGEHTRDFIYVDDVVKGFMKALKRGKPGTYNLCTGNSTKATDILSTLKEVSEWDGDWVDSVHDDPRLHVRMDNTKYKETFKVDDFTPLEEGLKQTFSWWKEKEKVIVDD